ncbi:MAG: reverse transcriptase domain-containing protein (plasmid) [Candidatus Manganitrophus sp.]|nr:MAG: reverse transcriptase domain-containing protein [Candidatus Manganitrophus sp.]
MPEIKTGEPFGLDQAVLNKIDWNLALKRIHQNLRSDFIYAPHLSFIFRKAGEVLTAMLIRELKSGTFSPGIPITMEVPKPFRIRVAVPSNRLGPNYSRPGSILLPKDRLLYQALADQAAPIVQAKSDPKRSFSHLLAPSGSASMFLPTRTCWNKLQKSLAEYSKAKSVRYILKIDVANFFGSLNQHTLINVLNDSGYEKALSSRLEAILTSYTGERSSRGILQGLYPSDLLGNYYLTPIDRILKDWGVPSARYVDDIYVFVKSVDEADRLLRALIPALRSYDLVLNEAKCIILPKSALATEEPDLEALFEDAVEEISQQVDDDDFNADYGFQSEWNEGEMDEEELELQATKLLFDSLSDYPGQEENIERFCLPLFTTAGSDYGLTHVIDSFKKRPSMSQIYASYLAKFLGTDAIDKFLLNLLKDVTLVDWQKIWVLAALYQVDAANDAAVKVALDVLKDANRHDALRAVAAGYVGSLGDHARRKALVSIYPTVSNYVQAAIYYASNQWPAVERRNAKASWGGHGPLHTLLTVAMKTKK